MSVRHFEPAEPGAHLRTTIYLFTRTKNVQMFEHKGKEKFISGPKKFNFWEIYFWPRASGESFIGKTTPVVKISLIMASPAFITRMMYYSCKKELFSRQNQPATGKNMLKRINDIQQLPPEDKTHLFALLDAFLRDHKARKVFMEYKLKS